ncbi:hypothetical protein KSF_036560 [Reticulibacter mediterranei]|uniref:Uncharacterized protein n=1 Tax=Reticulibacter mediterranei TaxID=2778369 RepID=A0A8J3N2P1_9CHLR|nr:hypothetical protein [Reticulibacter mediterranei]GHO93608.1 hypothetical protein KSF_036560 [Reticulibacter mediterranei]
MKTRDLEKGAEQHPPAALQRLLLALVSTQFGSWKRLLALLPVIGLVLLTAGANTVLSLPHNVALALPYGTILAGFGFICWPLVSRRRLLVLLSLLGFSFLAEVGAAVLPDLVALARTDITVQVLQSAGYLAGAGFVYLLLISLMGRKRLLGVLALLGFGLVYAAELTGNQATAYMLPQVGTLYPPTIAHWAANISAWAVAAILFIFSLGAGSWLNGRRAILGFVIMAGATSPSPSGFPRRSSR